MLSKKLIKIFILNFIICITIQFIFPIDNLKNEVIWRCLISFVFSYCIYKGIEEKRLVNPYLLFLLTPLSLMIYSKNVSEYFLLELRSDIWFLAIINMIAFLVGINIIQKKVIFIGKYNIFPVKNFIKNEKKRSYLIHGIILFIVGEVTQISSLIGIVLPVGQLFWVCQFLGIALVYKNGKKTISYIMAIIYLAISFITVFNKTIFLLLSMTFIVLIDSEIKTKKERKKIYFYLILIALIMILIVFPLKNFLATGGSLFEFASSDKDSLANYFIDRTSWKEKNIKLLMPYMYMVTNWTNLQYVLDTVTIHTHGLWFFKPILGYLQLSDGIEIYSMLKSYRFAFNTYGFIAVQYIDFGFWGSIFPSICLGLFSGLIYKRYKEYPDPFNCACYALTAVAIFEMFFSNHFFIQSYPFTIFIVAWIYAKIMKIKI